MDNIYLISNVHRSGSSMMMRCITEAGIPGLYITRLDYMLPSNEEYDPNPNGFYQNYPDILDRLSEAVGHVTKFPWRQLINLPVLENTQYNIVFLKRNPESIRASMEAFTPLQSWGADDVVLDFYNEIFDTILRSLAKRKDINLIVLNYTDIVRDPHNEFLKLVSAGWPIDHNIAASLVDPSLQRFKLENNA